MRRRYVWNIVELAPSSQIDFSYIPGTDESSWYACIWTFGTRGRRGRLFRLVSTLGITALRLVHPDPPRPIGLCENGHSRIFGTPRLIHDIITILHRPSGVFCHCHWRDNLLLKLMSKAHHYNKATISTCLTWRWMYPRLERHLGDF